MTKTADKYGDDQRRRHVRDDQDSRHSTGMTRDGNIQGDQRLQNSTGMTEMRHSTGGPETAGTVQG
ncbi:unnamed protein product [Staurois parvus]|uniref:Uncharacterized protein n=1 Tax=Staurois parvus TaxID=386267 RepID=A0ABN9BAU3_9NEOB|nr:unnamed protein product [Staurois parvus]